LLGNLSFGLLIVLAFLKPLATSFTLGSGNSGGVFAPALFTGAALGGAFGQVVESIAPGSTAGPGAFAVVGMAAAFAGAARAPFTAILIVFEMTNDYRLIVPLMAAVIVSMIVAERLHRESIYTLKLTRRGIHLQRGRDIDILQGVRVEEVMITPIKVPADLPIPLLAEEFVRTGRHGFAVVNVENDLIGVVSLRDYRQVMDRDDVAQLTVSDITTQDVVTVYPDQSVGLAMQKMAPRDLSRLPVVSRNNPRELLGMVRRNDIVRAYELGVMRRSEEVERVERRRIVRDGSAQYIDVTLSEASACNGKSVAELGLPDAAVLVAIRRGRELVIPRGNKVLHAGDTLTLLCEGKHVDEVRTLLLRSQDKEPVSSSQGEETVA
jgi:CIC family chloride channel protein